MKIGSDTTVPQPLVTLPPAEPVEFQAFKRDLQAAFALTVVEEMGCLAEGPTPSDADLDRSLNDPSAIVLLIMHDDRRVGGVVVTIDRLTRANSLDLLFVKVGNQGKGLGKATWLAIEKMFPDTRSWQTLTPSFEKRNIHFYVNVCGFHIVEYYHERNPDPHAFCPTGLPDDSEMFRFVKKMPHPPS